ncbi:protein of unknown function DUF202 [Desulfofundulus kuznetsovii DSM 6115]|uniref:DUF202 domain-containing protein n=1 Tax=Desulfofundulus kuznetsovii (strain DSM 6115 / VKM B-1805 / 17) TaxID=760568 RepID=A0AAU8PEU9_DESK7|nr:protein of unknown function DUF202 [Desulfofundulus kuznetsovii DSM 6115]
MNGKGREKEEQESDRIGDRQHIQEHLANERTFLSWIRTAVAILAFGFVVEKFSFYLRVLEWQAGMVSAPSKGSAAYLGIGSSIMAGLVVILAAVRYRQTRYQINQGTYRHSLTADMLLAAMLLLVTILVIIFLFHFCYQLLSSSDKSDSKSSSRSPRGRASPPARLTGQADRGLLESRPKQ